MNVQSVMVTVMDVQSSLLYAHWCPYALCVHYGKYILYVRVREAVRCPRQILKEELCRFGEKIKTQNCAIYNINGVMNKLFSEENKVPEH